MTASAGRRVILTLLLGLASAAHAEVQSVGPVDAGIQPDIVAGETAGDFILAYPHTGGLSAHELSSGRLSESQSLYMLESRNIGSAWFSAPSLALKPGYSRLQMAFESIDRTSLSTRLNHITHPAFGTRTGEPRDAGVGRLSGRSRAIEFDLLADSREGTSCCTLMAFTHPTEGWLGLELISNSGRALAQRTWLDAAGGGGMPVRHPALAYQSDAGFFVVAYETRRDIRVRLVYPSGASAESASFKWISGEYIVATKQVPRRYESDVDSKPSVAYSPEQRKFLVTWLDHSSSNDSSSRRVMARTLTRSGVPGGSSFAVQASCPPSNFSCLLRQPTASGSPQVIALADGFHVAFPARAWSLGAPRWGVLGYRLVSNSSGGFAMNWRWLSPTSVNQVSHLKVAYDPRSGFAAAVWLAEPAAEEGSISFVNTMLLVNDFLP